MGAYRLVDSVLGLQGHFLVEFRLEVVVYLDDVILGQFFVIFWRDFGLTDLVLLVDVVHLVAKLLLLLADDECPFARNLGAFMAKV